MILQYSTPSPTLPPDSTATTPNILTPAALHPRQAIWREPVSTYSTIAACQPFTLPAGTFVVGSTTILLAATGEPAVFTPNCYNGRPLLFASSPGGHPVIGEREAKWEDWIRHGDAGFNTSIVPIAYSIAGSAVTCWVITLAVLGFQRKRSLLYKLSLLCSSIFLLVILITSTNILNDQFYSGFLDSTQLRHDLRTSRKLNILNLTFNTVLYIAQVQTAVYLFSRQKEKRIVLWIGGSLTIIAQTIWGVSVLHPTISLNSLPAFSYLFQIALGVLYLCCVFYFAITNHRITLHHSMLIMTLLAILAVSATIILFIVDLASFWFIEWADSLAWITTVFSIVTVREWADRIYILQRKKQKAGVLGRPVYEDVYTKGVPRDTEANVVHESEPESDTESDSSSSTSQHTSNPSHTLHRRTVIDFKDEPLPARYFHKATYPIIYVSDWILNFGLAISRPLSSVSKPTAASPPTAENTERVNSNSEPEEAKLEVYLHDLVRNKVNQS